MADIPPPPPGFELEEPDTGGVSFDFAKTANAQPLAPSSMGRPPMGGMFQPLQMSASAPAPLSGQSTEPPPPPPGFELEPVQQQPSFMSNLKQGLLTNQPPQGVGGMVGRYALPTIGASIGSAGGTFLGAGVGSIPGAGIGAGAGEATRQAMVSAYTGQNTPATVGRQVGGQMLGGAGGQAAGEFVIGPALSKLGQYINNRIPATFQNAFTIPEEATKWAMQRGPNKVLTPSNASDATQFTLLQKAQDAMSNNLKAVGDKLGAVEDALASSDQPRFFDLSQTAQNLRAGMKDVGFSGPSAAFANQGDVAELNRIADQMQSGLASTQDVIRIKRLLDDKVTYTPGALKPVGDQASRLIKGAADDLRYTLRNAFPELGEAYDQYGAARETYDSFRKTLGGQSGQALDIASDAKALSRIRVNFLKGGQYKGALQQFDAKVDGAEGAMSDIFNTIVAKEFAKAQPGYMSPSSVVMRAAGAAGITAPFVAGSGLRAWQAGSAMAPQAIQAAGMGGRALAQPTGQALYDAYDRLSGGTRPGGGP